MRRVGFLLAIFCLAAAGAVCAVEPVVPNIVFVLCDDLGYGDFVMQTDAAFGAILEALE